MTVHKYSSEYVNPAGDDPNVPEVHDYDRTKPTLDVPAIAIHFGNDTCDCPVCYVFRKAGAHVYVGQGFEPAPSMETTETSLK